jgi:DNA-binding beta-propeller fold protein YncE
MPYTIKVDKGEIYILNCYHKLIKFSQQGKLLKTWRTFAEMRGITSDSYPLDFAINKREEVLLLDTHANKVVVFDNDGTELKQWGRMGSNPGEFNRPARISLDKDENVFILDIRNNCVQKYDADGNYLVQWNIREKASDFALLPDGSFWVNYGENISFYNAFTMTFQDWKLSEYIEYIDVDAYGTLYGKGGGEMFEFSEGKMIARFECDGLIGFLDGNPFTIDGNKNFLFANHMTDIVVAMDKEGSVVAQYGNDPGEYQLVHPFGVAVSHDLIFVSDVYLKDVLVFDKEGHFKNSWGATGKMPFEFSPSGIMYHDDVLYVVSKNCVFKFRDSGECIGKFGSEGEAPGQFQNARSITCDTEGFLYVADAGNKRIQKLTKEGHYVLHWSTEGLNVDEFNTPEDIAADKENTIYVLDTRGAVVMFTKEGELIRTAVNSLAVFQPQGIALGSDGNFFIAEEYMVKQFEYEGIRWDVLGEYGSDESQFHSISRITVSKDNLLYIADTLNKRVQVAEVISYPCD